MRAFVLCLTVLMPAVLAACSNSGLRPVLEVESGDSARDHAPARLRVPPLAPADDRTWLPVFLDLAFGDEVTPLADGPVLTSYDIVLEADPPEKVRLGSALTSHHFGVLDGWITPYEARWVVIPCDVATDPECSGTVDLHAVRTDTGERLASTSIELVEPTEELQRLAACGVGGNAASFIHVLSSGSSGPRAVSGLELMPYYDDYSYAGSDEFMHRLRFMTHNLPHPSYADTVDSFEFKWWNTEGLSPEVTRSSLNIGHMIPSVYSVPDLRIHDLEILPTDGADYFNEGDVPRATLSWNPVDHRRSYAGCFVYDEANPVMKFVFDPRDDEHGDTPEDATPVMVADGLTTIEATVQRGDEDWFRLELEGEGTLEITIEATFDPRGQVGFDGGWRTDNDAGEGNTFRFAFPAASGVYDLMVAGARSRDLGDYTVHVEAGFTGANGGVVDDHGDDTETATLLDLTSGTAAGEAQLDVSDVDVFALDLSEAADLHIQVDPWPTLDATGRLLSESGEVVAETEWYPFNDLDDIDVTVDAGVYYLEIASQEWQYGYSYSYAITVAQP